ncbi:MAG: NrsF family protein [Caulobacteraceae bacterium]
MRTADLVASLAAPAGPVRPAPITRPIGLAVLAGAAVAAALLIAWLGLRPLGEAVRTGPFWMKGGYTLALAAAGLVMAARLARPGGRLGRAPAIVLAAVAVMAILAALEMANARPGQGGGLWLGHTWRSCSSRIVILAAPIYVGTIWALRRLAPTRLAVAGAAAGLLAGAAAATVYGLYCQETTAPFVLAWYTLGVAACATIGAILGRRLLRW